MASFQVASSAAAVDKPSADDAAVASFQVLSFQVASSAAVEEPSSAAGHRTSLEDSHTASSEKLLE